MRLCPAPLLAALAASLIAGCDPAPTLEASKGARDAPYPDLIPAENILGQVTPDAVPPETSTILADRTVSLRARAARLKGSVIDAETQERLKSGVN